MSRRIRLLRGSTGDPLLDTGVSRAILDAVARGEEPETLRLHRPTAYVAFGSRDRTEPGFAEGVEAARGQGFEAVVRIAGGRAAVFHPDTIAFAWAVAADDPHGGVRARFEEVAGVVADALRVLGVDARVGEVPGEYCPGEHSVNAEGRRKLAGIGQRIVRGGAHAGGVVVVDGADRIRDVLVPVYRALGLDWDPDTAGSVSDEVGPTPWAAVEGALLEIVAGRFDLEEEALAPEHVEEARRLVPRHAAVA